MMQGRRYKITITNKNFLLMQFLLFDIKKNQKKKVTKFARNLKHTEVVI